MTCAQIADFLTDFLNDELPEPVHADFVAHMVICPDCQRYLDSFRKTIALEQATFDPVQEVARIVASNPLKNAPG